MALWEHRDQFVMDVFFSYRASGGINFMGEVPYPALRLEPGTSFDIAGMAALMSGSRAGEIQVIAQNWLQLSSAEAQWLFYGEFHSARKLIDVNLTTAITAIEWLMLGHNTLNSTGATRKLFRSLCTPTHSAIKESRLSINSSNRLRLNLQNLANEPDYDEEFPLPR